MVPPPYGTDINLMMEGYMVYDKDNNQRHPTPPQLKPRNSVTQCRLLSVNFITYIHDFIIFLIQSSYLWVGCLWHLSECFTGEYVRSFQLIQVGQWIIHFGERNSVILRPFYLFVLAVNIPINSQKTLLYYN